MKRAKQFVRVFLSSLAAVAVWLTAASLAVAQPNPPAGSGGSSGGMDYVLSYMVVILAIVLGMLAVARSSNRRERERPTGYVGKSSMKDE
jgi:hypothetical protein